MATSLLSTGFKTQMFVYSAENTGDYTVSKLKVCIPEVFLDKKIAIYDSYKIGKEDTNIFCNDISPAISPTVNLQNYITLPVFCNSGRYIKVGDKFCANFINGNPESGFIIARF